MEFAAAFELIDFPPGWIRSGREIRWQRRINVARADDVQNTNRIGAYRHGEVVRQLALDLSTDDIDCGNFQIWHNRPGGLLRTCRSRKSRNHTNAIRCK